MLFELIASQYYISKYLLRFHLQCSILVRITVICFNRIFECVVYTAVVNFGTPCAEILVHDRNKKQTQSTDQKKEQYDQRR